METKATAKAKATAIPAYVRKVLAIWSVFYAWVSSPAMFEKIDQKRAMLAYQGSKPRNRNLDSFDPKGQGNKYPALQGFLRNNLIPFTTALSNDGEIFRMFDALGNESGRFFLSARGKYQGMFGVSGKVRARIETLNPNTSFEWHQQGSKNYYFSPCFQGLYTYLTTLKV